MALTLVEWRGLSATEAGLALTAATISWTAGAWIQARGATRWPTHLFVRLGFAVTTVGLAGMLLVLDQDVPWPIAIVAFGVAGLGMGLAYSPLALIVLREASPEAQGTSTSALSLTDSLGTALGTGLTGALVAASLRMNDNPAAGLAAGFALAVLIGLGGLVLSGRLRPRTVPAAVARDGVRAAAVVDGPDACGRLRALTRGCAPCRAPDQEGPIPCLPRSCARRSARSPTSRSPGSCSTTSRRCSRTPPPTRRRSTSCSRPTRTSRSTSWSGWSRAGSSSARRWRTCSTPGLVPVRKLGKLPAETITVEYALEYGSNTLEIHRDAITAGQKVLIVDDLLATGGTVHGTIELIERLKGEVVGLAFLVELEFLKGRDRLEGRRVTSVIKY